MKKSGESRRQREERIKQVTARVGFEAGFKEGTRATTSLLMGIPLPSAVIVDDSLPPGTSVLYVSSSSTLQAEKVSILSSVVAAVHGEPEQLPGMLGELRELNDG
jgi:hypothetical protein